MFKLLLCLRYLRSRYIALASIVSVTLGVATMIVVNSVMSGFQAEMYKRLHGILSDLVIESHSMEGLQDPESMKAQVRQILGSDLAGITCTVHLPAMVSIPNGDQWIPRQVNFIGIDEETYAEVSDFSRFLLHPENQRRLGFDLHEDDYDPRLQMAGWSHRRNRAAYEKLRENLEPAPTPSVSLGLNENATSTEPEEHDPFADQQPVGVVRSDERDAYRNRARDCGRQRSSAEFRRRGQRLLPLPSR